MAGKNGAPRYRHPRRWSEGGNDGGPVHCPPATDRGVDDGRCVRRLFSEMHIPIKDMQNLRLCIECALEDPAQLDMELPAAPLSWCSRGLPPRPRRRRRR